MDLQIKRDGVNVTFKPSQALPNINIPGLISLIMNIQPVNVHMILGLVDDPLKEEKEKTLGKYSQPLDRIREDNDNT